MSEVPLLSERQGQNLALTVLYVPYSLDSDTKHLLAPLSSLPLPAMPDDQVLHCMFCILVFFFTQDARIKLLTRLLACPSARRGVRRGRPADGRIEVLTRQSYVQRGSN